MTFKIDMEVSFDDMSVFERFIEHIQEFTDNMPAHEPVRYPKNHGKPWTQQDKEELLFMFFHEYENCFLSDIAKEMGRTPFAIECQLDRIFHTDNFDWTEVMDRVGSEDWEARFRKMGDDELDDWGLLNEPDEPDDFSFDDDDDLETLFLFADVTPW